MTIYSNSTNVSTYSSLDCTLSYVMMFMIIAIMFKVGVTFSENVPGFYDSTCYKDLKELLALDFPYMVGPIQIDS